MSSETPAEGRGRIAYLCLQATREGQASHAHVHGIVNGLQELGWEVDLFQPDYADRAEDPGLWPRLREFARVQIDLVRSLNRYDVLYVRNHAVAFPTALVARHQGVPVVREINGTYRDIFTAWPWTASVAPVFRFSIRRQIQWSDALIAVTEGLGEWARDQGAEAPVRVIPNAADADHFRPDARTTRDLPERYAIFFGALAPWQGIDTLLEAVRRPEWPGPVELVVAGEGALQQRVEAAASAGDIVYVGRVPYEEMPGVVAGSMASLSTQENVGGKGETGLSPLKVFESMACGVPVVVSDFPGQADLVRSVNCGIVVAPNDASSIARAVARLADHPEEARACGGRGRKAVEKRHSWRSRAGATDRVLRGCVRSTRDGTH